ncbi:MAG: pyridoxamine 5'-phosphate oxidase family protein [Candidatus Nanopelagicaceae bacterium]|nr:pyridoxamine 5'-phosphate oxidase family protein [Candidatus Nanopelagicaceae bacterium]
MGTVRTKVRRSPDKQVDDPEVLRAILARAIIAHVGIAIEGQPFVIPVACAPFKDELLLHGSTASRLFKALAAGTPACVSITLVDALVLARTSFDSSMRYHSLMAFGKARVIEVDEKVAALEALTDHLFPERAIELRQSNEQEIKATSILAFPLSEISIKVSNSVVDDAKTEPDTNIWAGIVPLSSDYELPIPAEDLRPGISVPEYISRWPKNRI